MGECIFCEIVKGNIKSEIVYEDENVLAFKDLNAQAPVHTLIIPKKHISTINDLGESDGELVGKLFAAAKDLAKSEGISEPGYRLVMNCNEGGGQSVFHIHLHLLGGRQMRWPPG